MRLTCRYRLYPNKAREEKFGEWLESLRLLYISALVERQNVYKADERGVSVYEQKRALPDLSMVDSHEGLAFEKLYVRNMMRNPHLAKSIAVAGWSTLVSITAYKAEKPVSRSCWSNPKEPPKTVPGAA